MHKHLILAVVALLTPFFTGGAGAQTSAAPYLPAEIREAMKGLPIDAVRFDDRFNLFEVLSNGNVFYMTKDYKYLVLGNIIDIQKQVNLTAERMASLKRVDFSSLDKTDAIKISNGSRALAVFSDPDCPYCQKLHTELRKLKDVAVYVYLYPLESLHPTAKKKSISAWCSSDKVAAADTIFSGKAIKGIDCANPIDRNIQKAVGLKINGTPAILFESGEIVNGYITADKISEKLEARDDDTK